jgi:hypothetical protein
LLATKFNRLIDESLNIPGGEAMAATFPSIEKAAAGITPSGPGFPEEAQTIADRRQVGCGQLGKDI